ncbi:uncharacterized protein K02A2.6-like [Drosophila willistoni]|uniref:uncharacterized protein K02A2.6-like n=1 Tax=Drosophila willistoni TaxID=7260 RepID=UPI001F07AE5B|nr:uncharacterized protein K02A2.6-like [Drosophila willistoni]
MESFTCEIGLRPQYKSSAAANAEISGCLQKFSRGGWRLLAGCPNALNYIADVIVFGKNEEEHDKALTAVLKVFDTHNVVLNKQKCVYKTTKLKFLGHILSDHGIEADPEKVKVITDFRAPKTKEETRSFMGLVTYLGKFIPDLDNTTDPLKRLIKANTKFDWTNKEQQAFDTSILRYFERSRREAVAFDWQNEQNIFQIVAKGVPKSLTISEIMENSMQVDEVIDAMTYLSTNSWEANSSSPYYPFRWELSTVGNVLLRGTKIVIATILQSQVLELAHEGHPGESAMKRRLRSKVWWPRICQGLYMELKFIKTISSKVLIEQMDEIFSRLGTPRTLRTDNGRQFVSLELQDFCRTNGITQITTPPYWPQANGEVENMNKSLVKCLKIAWSKGKDYKREIQNFAMMYKPQEKLLRMFETLWVM